MEFASTHIYAYNELSDEEDINEEDLFEQNNPMYMAFGADEEIVKGQKASQLPDVIYDNAGRRPPEDTTRAERLPDGIYDNAGRMLPQAKVRQDDGVIYDNRPETAIPPASSKVEDLYASPYDFPRKAPLYQDVDINGRPPPPSLPPPLPPGNKVNVKTQSAGQEADAAKPASKKIRRADTNVIAVHFDKLVQASSLHANQPIICTNCGAVFSRLSGVTDQIWRCEFCDQRNNIKVSLEDLQQKEDTTFIIQPPSERGDDKAVIFCVDVSGSMSVTTEVSGEVLDHQRPNDLTVALQAYQEEMAGSSLYGRTPTKIKVSYVSRLQAMQSAVDQQLDAMQSTVSNKRVGLVAFNDLVTIIGDGTDYPMPLEGASLTDKDTVISLGCSIPLPQPLLEVRRCLSDKVFSLVEGGQTALGPALLLSTAIASQKAGSKVIICTDGKANVGLGNLDDDEAYEEAVTFYDEVGDYARDAGVSVSVVTVEGEDCRAIELGNVADKTGGKVTIVDTLKLGEEFASILEDNILATNVSVKLVLHNGLYIKDEYNDQSKSVAARTIGNVSKESETTFEFGVRIKEVLYDNFGGALVEVQETTDEPVYDTTKSQAKNLIEGLERLPFQLQVQYTDAKGAQYLRVITLDKPVTKDRKFAEHNANVAVLGTHAAQSAAKLAVEGNYNEARINALVTQRLVERHVQSQEGEGDDGIYSTFVSTMAPIHNELHKAQTLERGLLGHSLSDVEEDEEENATYEPGEFIERKKRGMTKKAKQRRKKISDHQANLFYKMKNATSKMFHPQGKSYSMADDL